MGVSMIRYDATVGMLQRHPTPCERYHAASLLACGVATAKMIKRATDFAIACYRMDLQHSLIASV
jgi:hypothetical protein